MPDTGVYELLLVLHLVTVIGGFGSIALDGVYRGRTASGPGPSGPVSGEQVPSGEEGPSLSEWLIYAVPITGLLLVLVSEDRWQFSQAWISLSFLLYIAAVGVMHAGRRRNPAATSAAVNLLVLGVVVLMVTKPGA